MRELMNLIIFLSLSLIAGCTLWGKPINYDPHFYAHDYQSMSIVDRDNKTVKCNEEEFNQYASLSKDKIKELAAIIKAARLPDNYEPMREKILNELKAIYDKKH